MTQGGEQRLLHPTAVCPFSLSSGRLHAPSRAPLSGRAPLAKTSVAPHQELQSQHAVKNNPPLSPRFTPRAGALLTARSSQGGVEEDVGGRGLDGGGGHVRHLVVVELEPALLGVVLAVGCVVSAVQPTVMVLCGGRGNRPVRARTHSKEKVMVDKRMCFCCCY